MKIAGSYASLLRGVSQQPAESRVDGQHAEQVNMLPDPVAGLTRRRGTLYQGGSFVPVDGNGIYTADYVASTGAGYRKLEHRENGVDYVILYRTEAMGGAFVGTGMPPVLCYNRATRQFIGVSWSVAGRDWQANVRASGIQTAVSIGRYIVWALKGNPCSLGSTPRWGQAGYRCGTVWIRGGTYNRTYSINVGGSTYSYTTPASTWTGSPSAEQIIQPAYIAQQLAGVLNSNGFTGVQAVGSHLTFDVGAGVDISTSDGGDGGLMRSAGQTIDAVEKLPLMSVPGHIVKVQPSADSWFYVKAVAKAAVNNTLQEVIWRECAGEDQGNSIFGLGMARVYNDTLYIGMTSASDITGLGHMPVFDNPTLVVSQAGDSKLNPPHRWMNNQINYLGVFQDRLLVGSGAALSVSGAGDYLNFFRSTMTTVPVGDGFEVIPQGGEDDTLRHSVTYNKNLVIFGDRRQYLIPGTVPFTPVAPNMSIMTVYANGAECPPVAAGGQIYYARNREGWASVHQIQPGQYVDSAESFPASAQAGSYIPAPAVEMEAIPGVPSMLALRSRNAPRDIYVFSYVDLPDGRKQDAWLRLTFHTDCGYLMGMHATPEGLLLFWARKSWTDGGVYRVCDLLPLSVHDNDLPYLDSMRTRKSVGYSWPGNNGIYPMSGGPINGAPPFEWVQAFGKYTRDAQGAAIAGTPTPRFLYGSLFTDINDAAIRAMPEAVNGGIDADTRNVVGLPFPSSVTLTNPFARDGKGQAILNGRTTITSLAVNTRDSGGLAWDLTAHGTTATKEWSGSLAGGLPWVTAVPVLSARITVPVGRETREYDLTLKARKWYPLNIKGIDWIGQSFNRTPRASSGG